MTNNARICLANLLFWFAVELFLPVLPLFYNNMGLRNQQIGFAIGAFSLGSVLSRLLAGNLSDRYGCKLVASIGLVLSILSLSGYFFTNNFFVILFFRFFHGISSAGYSSASITLITLITPENKMKKTIALYTLCSMIGIGIATSIGITIYHFGNFNLIIIISLTSLLLSFILFPKINKTHDYNREKNIYLPMHSVIFDPFVYVPSIIQFTVYFGFSSIMTFLPLLIISQGFNDNLWVFYLAYALSVVILRLFISQLSDLITTPYFLFYILIFFTMTMLIPVFSITTLAVVLIGVGVGMSTGVATPLLANMISSNTEVYQRGTALGFFCTAIDLGIITGSFAMGYIAESFGYNMMFCCVFIFAILSAIFYYLWISYSEGIFYRID